jgi:integrase/recombinase XerD
MSGLAGHLRDYLSMRRALGFKLELEGYVLPQFVAFVDQAGTATLTVEHAVSWVGLTRDLTPTSLSHRLGAVRGFAKYLQAIDPATEVPPADVFGPRQRRPAPYLWSDDEIRRLLEAAGTLRPPPRAATHQAFFGLLAVSGMRLGEALGLEDDDVDLGDGVLTIREAKFGRSRLVPLHESAVAALRSYAACSDGLCPKRGSNAFFVAADGTALAAANVRYAFNRITTAIGMRTSSVHPRIHDLRHTFAVRTLIGWYRSGVDVSARMTVLSTYLGHVNPVGTYWYLSASPELMELAASRLEGQFGGGR